MKRLRIGFITLAIIIVLASTCQATTPKINFKYDSLICGVHNPANSGMTDTEWRTYYTGQFDTVYADKHISSRPYDWYVTQIGTKLSDNNCGVSCLAMVLKWYDPTQDKTVDLIRDEIGGTRGITNEGIDLYLTSHNIPHNVSAASIDNFKSTLERGEISIAIIKIDDTLYHSIIINGVYTFKDKQYFTYYNPYGGFKEYSLDDIDTTLYMQNWSYSVISSEDLAKELYTGWSANILPKQ